MSLCNNLVLLRCFMGTTASTHRTVVKSISIDQNGWNRPCSNDRGNSAASRRSLPILSNLIGNKSCREDGLTKAERLRLVDRAIRSESAALECEEKVKRLEREIRKLELRNHDLSTEVCWLRQQCSITCPDVPNDSMASVVQSRCTEQCQVESKLLQDTLAKQDADLKGLRMKVDQMMAVDMRKDIRISELVKELDAAKARINSLEELCRNQIGGMMPMTTSSSADIQKQESSNTVLERRNESQQKVHKDHFENRGGETANIEPSNTKNSAVRAGVSTAHPSLREIFITDKYRRIDGKVRPSTAIEPPSPVPRPAALERRESVPVLKSVHVLQGIPQTIKPDKHAREHYGDSYNEGKSIVEDLHGDGSDIDITTILDTSHKSAFLSPRSQPAEKRHSEFCRCDSLLVKHPFNKKILYYPI